MSVAQRTGYGARPVSIDVARGRSLSEPAQGAAPNAPSPTSRLPLTHQVVADRLALAHWPRGHQIFVCGLAGGSGRTTVAGLMATVLAELPYASIWPPYALIDAEPRTPTLTARRWDVLGPEMDDLCTRSGVWVLQGLEGRAHRNDFSALVIDCGSGLPSDLLDLVADRNSSVVMVTRPDRTSVSDAADALVRMNDHELVSRKRVTVVVNQGVGERNRGSHSAATVLGIRCAAIHSLPADPAVGPSCVLPSGRDLPQRIRRTIARLCLDVWAQVSSSSKPHDREHV